MSVRIIGCKLYGSLPVWRPVPMHVVTAACQMAAVGVIDGETAVRMVYKFAGEPVSEEGVGRILSEVSTQIAPAEKTEEQ